MIVVLDVCKVLRMTAAANWSDWLYRRVTARFASFGFLLENRMRDFGRILSRRRIAVGVDMSRFRRMGSNICKACSGKAQLVRIG